MASTDPNRDRARPRSVDAINIDEEMVKVEKRRVTDKLPDTNNTNLMKKFFAASGDNLFQPEVTEKLTGFIGQLPSYVDLDTDFYIKEPNSERREHQLEPVMVSVDPDDSGNITNLLTYDDVVDQIRFQGGIVNNEDRLFDTPVYTWSPPIDIDKILNFSNYFWFPGGPDVIRFSEVTNVSSFIGTSSSVVIEGVELQDGDRVLFEDDLNILYKDRIFIVQGIGVSFTLILDSAFSTYAWDDLEAWDSSPWDGIDVEQLVSVENPDYIVMERGAQDGNAWSRRNRWYHRNDLSASQLEIALTRQAERPIIEFIKNLELLDHGTFGRRSVTVRDDITTDPDVQIVGQSNYTIDGISLGDGDRILFTNSPSLQGIWDLQPWDDEALPYTGWDPFFGVIYSAPTGDIQLQSTSPFPGMGQGIAITSTDDFVTQGFVVGMKVIISGSTIQPGGTGNQDGTYTIQSVAPTIMIFEEPFPSAIPTTGFTVHPYENNSITIYQDRVNYQNRVFEVNGVGSSITLTLVADGQNTDGSPADGDQLLVLLGLTYQNQEFYWSDIEDSWITAQTKLTTNQAPLFQLYDSVGVKLQDPGKYPLSDFEGNKIFSFQINSDPRQPNDSVLGIPLVFNEFGEIMFQNHLVTDRYTYNAPTEEIPGFYFHRTIGINNNSDFYGDDWYLKELDTRQFLLERFIIEDDDTDRIKLSLAPDNPTETQIFVNGVEQLDNQWVISGNEIDFFNFFEVDDLVQVRYFSSNNLPDDSSAVYEIPNNLEDNPDNLEISYIANSDYFSHFTSIIANQLGLTGSANGANNYRNTQRSLNAGTEVFQHRAPMFRLMALNSDNNIDYMRSVRYVQREYARFRNKFLRKLDEYNRDGIHNDTQTTTLWIEDALTSINLGKTDAFPFYRSGMGTRTIDEPTYMPPSPSRLGMHPVYKPQKYLDSSLATPLNVLQLHDGTQLIAFEDYRDDVILDFEQNIYDNIPEEYKGEVTLDFDIKDHTDSQFRNNEYSREEFNRLLTPIIQRWAISQGLDLTENNTYSPGDPFTWNYSKQGLPGYWRGIYKWFYDTDRPNTHPWEMFGFSEEPDWWATRYGTAPFTSFSLLLWDDMRAGRIASGPRQGIDPKYARPGAPTPVNGSGDLLDPVTLGVALQPGIIDAKADWEIGDHGPVETVFRRSEYWGFAVAQLSYLMKPARFIEFAWDAKRNLFRYDDQIHPQWVNTDSEDRQMLNELYMHNETLSDGSIYEGDGLTQWITDYVISNGQNVSTIFGDIIRNTQVRLGHKMAGFINTSSMRVLADNFGLVPTEDIQTTFYRTPSIREEIYSGVIIERVDAGWEVNGYDALNPSFTILPPLKSSKQIPIEVGTIRVLESAEAKTNEVTIPYGTKFTTQQAVYDFLIGYGKYLESRGWIFDEFSLEQNETKNWRLSGKQFLFWSQGRWDIGSIIAISPFAVRAKFNTDQGAVQSIERVVNGVYSLLNKNGSAIQPEQTSVSRFEDDVVITPTEPVFLYSIRLSIAEYEHVITFNNTTVFDDLIYDPLYGLRQQRFKLFVTRTAGWDGKVNSPGYIVTRNGLTPNFEKTTNDFRRYFDIENSVEREAIQDTARRVVGFQTRDYLDNLLLSEDTQFQFYQGFIRQKGTNIVLDRLLRSNFLTDSGTPQIFEEWAFRLGEFGAVVDETTIEFLVREEEWRSDPQLIEFLGPNNTDNLFDDVIQLSPSDPRWVRKPPITGIAEFPLRNPNAEIRTENAAYLFRTDNPSAGYPLTTEVTHRVNTIEDRNEIFDNLIVMDEEFHLSFGDTVWVDDIEKYYSVDDPTTPDIDEGDPRSIFNFGFMVYRYTDTGLTYEIPVLSNEEGDPTVFLTNTDHGFVENDIVMLDDIIGSTPDINGSYEIDIPSKYTHPTLFFENFFENVSGEYILINGEQVDIICNELFEVVDLINSAGIFNILSYDNGDGKIRLLNLSGDTISLEVGSTANVVGAANASYPAGDTILAGNSIDPLKTYTLRGGIQGISDSTYAQGSVVEINGISVTLSSGSNVTSAVIDINAANIPDVFAYNTNNNLRLISSASTITLEDISSPGVAGAFLNLGFPINNVVVTGTSGATYTNGETIVINGTPVDLTTGTDVASAIIDIQAAAVPNIVASDTSGALTITSPYAITLTEDNSIETAVADLGFTPGTTTNAATIELSGNVDDAILDINTLAVGSPSAVYTSGDTIVVDDVVVMLNGTTPGEAVTSINRATIPDVEAILTDTGALAFVSVNESINLQEGTGSTLNDLGFAPGNYSGSNDVRASKYQDALLLSNINKTSMVVGSSQLVVQKGTGTAFNDLGFAPEPVSERLSKNALEKIGFMPGNYGTIATDMFTISPTVTAIETNSFIDATIGVWTESRFKTPIDRNSAVINTTLGTSIGWQEGEYTWIDDGQLPGTNPQLWEVQQYQSSVWVTATTPDDEPRIQSRRIDTELFKQSLLYNRDTNITQAYLNIFDPAKGLFPAQLLKEVTFRIEYDPAKYTNGDSELFQIDETKRWGERQVGLVWWDVSEAKYEAYEQGSNRERRNKWGQLAPDGEIVLWEWVKSPVPPSGWADYVEANASAPASDFDYKPSGEAFKADETADSPYVQTTELNRITDIESDVYYFWVKNSETIPNVENRDRSVAELTRSMVSPTSAGIPWLAAIGENAIITSGIEVLLTENDSVVQMTFNVTRKDNNIHREWKLSREGDERDVPTDRFWNKMADSLVGYDYALQPVPDPNLEESRKYGNFIRPRQSWFRDRELAGQVFLGQVNDLLSNDCIVDERPSAFDNLYNSTTEPTEYTGFIESTLASGITSSSQTVVSLEDTTGFPTSGKLVINGERMLYNGITEDNNVIITLRGAQGTTATAHTTGSTVNATIDRTSCEYDYHVSDNIERDALVDTSFANSSLTFAITSSDTSLTVNSSTGFFIEGDYLMIDDEKMTYEYINGNTFENLTRGVDGTTASSHNNNAKVRRINQQVWVDGTSETLDFWKVYKFDGVTAGTTMANWTEVCSESYKVSDFWNFIDYYETGFSAETSVNLIVDTTAERDTLTDVEDGFLVQVNDSNDDSTNIWAWYEYNSSDTFNPWVLVAKQDCTIEFDVDLFYDSTYGSANSTTGIDGRDEALKEVIDALRNDILTDEEQNLAFYASVRYVFSEQDLVDWVFKTTYLLGVGLNRSANQNPIFRSNEIDDLIEFIKEAKPYHSKLRDFITNEDFGIDTYVTHVTDFDKPVDSETGEVLDPSDPEDATKMNTDGSDQNDWFTHYLIEPEVVRSFNLKILFDRVSCDNITGWDPLFGWDSGVNENWDITSLDVGEDTAVERILKLYDPQPLTQNDVTTGNIDPYKNIKETKDLQSIISGCSFNGTIIDGDNFIIDIDDIDTFLNGNGFIPGASIDDENIIVDGNLFIQPDVGINHPEELILSTVGESLSMCVNFEKIIAVRGAPGAGATFTNNETILINGIEITMNGAFVADAVDSINAAAEDSNNHPDILNVRALLDGDDILIVSSDFENVDATDIGITYPITIELAEGSGTALADIGLTAGTYDATNDDIVDNDATNIAFRLFLNNINAKNGQNIVSFKTATLAADLTVGGTEVQLESTSGFPEAATAIVGKVDTSGNFIEYEFIEYSAITPTRFIGLTRDNPLAHDEGSVVLVLDPSLPQIADWESFRIDGVDTTTTGDGTTELAQDFKLGDTEIELADVAGLPKQPPSQLFLSTPGVIWIGGERIEFFKRDGTTLKFIRRGSGGTSGGIPSTYDGSGNLVTDHRDATLSDVVYPAGTKVVDGSNKQMIPGGYIWAPRPLGMQLDDDTRSEFLRDKPGKC